MTDKTFNSVNEFVHDPDTSFEQLQWMCLTLASRLQHSRDALEKIRDTAKSWEGRKDAPYWNLGDIAANALMGDEK